MEVVRFNLSRAERAVYQHSLIRFARLRVAVDLAQGDQQELVRFRILTDIIEINRMILVTGQRPYNEADAERIRQLRLQLDGLITELIAVGRGQEGGGRIVVGPSGDYNNPQ